MDDIPVTPAARNPETQAIHHRQVFWQITLPLVILGLIFLALTVLVSLNGAGYQSRWADISLIWCLCPNLLVLLLCVGSLGGMSYGLFRLQRVLPGKMYSIQKFSHTVRDGVQKVSDAAVEPVMKAQSSRAGQKTLWKNIHDFFKRPPRDEA
jgi:hypothetical protein